VVAHDAQKSRFALLILVALISTFPAIGTRARHNFQTSTAATNAPITIPFELVTRHIMLKVRINNSRPLSFVFDTGDKVCVVDTEVAKELGLKMEGQLRIGGAGLVA
jgi:aspartyl protease